MIYNGQFQIHIDLIHIPYKEGALCPKRKKCGNRMRTEGSSFPVSSFLFEIISVTSLNSRLS